MPVVNSHFVFGTGSAYSHTQPVINLIISLVTLTPDLAISVIIHKNNESICQKEIDAAPGHAAERIKLYIVGEETAWNDTSTYMTMVYKSGEAYGAILATPSSWPSPPVFILDITSFFYVQVKSAVEAHFPHIKSPTIVGYMPESTGEILFHCGAVEHGSLRWVDDELRDFDPELFAGQETSFIASTAGGDETAMQGIIERLQKTIPAYQAVVTGSDREVRIPGHAPLHLFERWGVEVDWSDPVELGWFQFLSGLQATAPSCQAWITCFPSSILEPGALAAAQSDEFISDHGKKPFLEMGWFEAPVATGKALGEGVEDFLNKFGPQKVVYISFGTLVAAGFGLTVLLRVLKETSTSFLYACGHQKDSLPANIKELLEEAEKSGLGLAPDWVHQVGVLHHKSIMCFISHCGVNSIIEGIMSAVPIICWARRWDQIGNSAIVGSKGLGIELFQHRSGVSIGREVLHAGVKVEGTPEALQREIIAALEAVKGEKGNEIRIEARRVGEVIRAERASVWEENVKKFGQFGRV